jgi:hypothetical protein
VIGLSQRSVERASRIVVLASTVLAAGGYAWLTAPVLPAGVLAAAAGLLAATFALARVAAPIGLLPLLLSAYLGPGLLRAAFGTADYHLILVWLAMLAGPVLALSPWRGWHLPALLRILVAGWALVIALTWPIVALREIDFSVVAARTLDTGNGLRAGPPWHAAAWVTTVALGQMLGLLWLDLLWLRYGGSRLAQAARQVAAPLAVSAAVGAAAGLYQTSVDLQWMNAGDWPSLGRAAGLMLDANSFGMSAAVWTAMASVGWWQGGRSRLAAFAVTGLLLAGMWTSGSRTALLTLVAGLAGVVVAALRRLGPWQARLVPVGVLVTLAALVLVLSVAPRTASRSSPLARVLDTLPAADRPSLERFAVEMWERDGYGVAAASALAEFPVSGVGVGAFNMLASDYAFAARGAAIQPDNAQNWWRHQLVELGAAGGLTSVLFSLVLIGLMWRARARPGHESATTVVKSVLAGIGLAACLGVPTQHPALWLTFVTLVFFLLALVSPWPFLDVRTAVARPAWTAVWGVAVLCAALQWQAADGPLRVAVRAQRFGFPYAYGFSAPLPASGFDQLRWTGRRAVAVLPVQARRLELQMWALHPDIAAAPVRVRVTAGAQVVADEDLRDQKPIVRVVEAPPGARLLPLDIEVSRTFGGGRGLRVGARWRREP